MSSPELQASLSVRNVALGVCGGIAAYKAVEVLRGLQKAGCNVRVAMTKRACEFVQPLTFRALSGSHVIVDDYAPDNPDPIAHITFSQTVDLLIVAPATANIIAKFQSKSVHLKRHSANCLPFSHNDLCFRCSSVANSYQACASQSAALECKSQPGSN